MKITLIRIQGGIGNQLFQLKRIISESGDTLILVNYLSGSARRELIRSLLPNNAIVIDNSFFCLFAKIVFFFGRKFLGKEYDFRLKNIRIIDGYFIGEDVGEALLREIYSILKNNYNSRLSRVSDKCAIHIRLGDYLKHENRNYNVCGVDYYKRSIDIIASTSNIYDFEIFTDQRSKAENMIREIAYGSGYSFTFHDNSSNDVEDLLAMSCFDYLICSNSTFSWWAARLGDNKSKVTICPRVWNKDPSVLTPVLDYFTYKI